MSTIPDPVMETCSACKGTGRVETPQSMVARHTAALDEFAASHRHLYCPCCRKRVSAMYDSIDGYEARPWVQMHCPHCSHRWEVLR